MSEIAEPILSKDDIWKAHVLKAKASRLSDTKYCKKNELSVWMFTTYKKKLGFTKPRIPKPAPELSAFVKAVPTPLEEKEPPAIVPHLHSILPDAIWLADFVRKLLETKK
jgi:hypothetical protein